ncbi:MAG: hypothetical protein AAGK32_19275, partial [Actinomycetota bacterium]
RGLPPAIRDRRSGVIETDDRIGAGWFEPWRLEPSSDLEGTATASTVRRRARVEFRCPSGGVAADVPDEPAAGADLFGVRSATPVAGDLLNGDGPFEVRVRVTVERAHRPGLRVDTWSRRLTTQSRIERPGPPRTTEPTTTWWPVARDPGLEADLLADIAARMGGARSERPDPSVTG